MNAGRPETPQPPDRRGRRVAIGLTLAGLAIALGGAALSDGFYQDDDCTHYLIALDAWENPGALWHLWARPGYNIPAALAARSGGMTGCRILSALMTAATSLLGYGIARRALTPIGLERFARWAPAVVWVQPLVLTLSLTTLTETPAALYMALGTWLWLRRNRVGACAAWSLLFITRPETMGLAPIVAAAGLWDAWVESGHSVRRTLTTAWLWACPFAALWAPAMWVIGAEAAGLPPGESPVGMFSRGYTDVYGTGDWGHFVVNYVAAAGAATVGCAVLGAVILRGRARIVGALALGLVLLHTMIYRYGLFASGGYPRFLVPGAALTAALGVGGVGAILRQPRRAIPADGAIMCAASVLAVVEAHPYLHWGVFVLVAVMGGVLTAVSLLLWRRRQFAPLLAPAMVILLAALAIAQAAGQVRPLRLDRGGLHGAVHEAVRRTDDREGRSITTHVLVPYLRRNAVTVFDVADARRRWLAASPGELFFWDSKYGQPSDNPHDAALLYASLESLGERVCLCGKPPSRVEVFRRRAAGPRDTARATEPSSGRSSARRPRCGASIRALRSSPAPGWGPAAGAPVGSRPR